MHVKKATFIPKKANSKREQSKKPVIKMDFT